MNNDIVILPDAFFGQNTLCGSFKAQKTDKGQGRKFRG